MWQFISHPVMRPPLWTWVRLGPGGAVEARSPGTFASYEEARRDAEAGARVP